MFAEQLPDHVRRALDHPEERLDDLLWHLSESERLGVFSKAQIAMLLSVLDFLEANNATDIRGQGLEARMSTVRQNLARLHARPE